MTFDESISGISEASIFICPSNLVSGAVANTLNAFSKSAAPVVERGPRTGLAAALLDPYERDSVPGSELAFRRREGVLDDEIGVQLIHDVVVSGERSQKRLRGGLVRLFLRLFGELPAVLIARAEIADNIDAVTVRVREVLDYHVLRLARQLPVYMLEAVSLDIGTQVGRLGIVVSGAGHRSVGHVLAVREAPLRRQLEASRHDEQPCHEPVVETYPHHPEEVVHPHIRQSYLIHPAESELRFPLNLAAGERRERESHRLLGTTRSPLVRNGQQRLDERERHRSVIRRYEPV